MQAGLPLCEPSVPGTSGQGQKPQLHKVLGNLADQVEGGATFSQLASHPKSFNKLYVSMVRAGEASGATGNRAGAPFGIHGKEAARIAGKK